MYNIIQLHPYMGAQGFLAAPLSDMPFQRVAVAGVRRWGASQTRVSPPFLPPLPLHSVVVAVVVGDCSSSADRVVTGLSCALHSAEEETYLWTAQVTMCIIWWTAQVTNLCIILVDSYTLIWGQLKGLLAAPLSDTPFQRVAVAGVRYVGELLRRESPLLSCLLFLFTQWWWQWWWETAQLR